MKDKFEENYDGPSSYQSFYDMAQYTFKWILNYFDKNLWPIQDKYADFEVIEDDGHPNYWYKITLKPTHKIDNFELFANFQSELIAHISIKGFPFVFEINNEFVNELPYKEIIKIQIWFVDYREAYDLFLNNSSDEENHDNSNNLN